MAGRVKQWADAKGLILLQVRVPQDLVKQIDHLGVDLDLFRAGVVELLLREALAARAAEPPSGAAGGGAG